MSYDDKADDKADDKYTRLRGSARYLAPGELPGDTRPGFILVLPGTEAFTHTEWRLDDDSYVHALETEVDAQPGIHRVTFYSLGNADAPRPLEVPVNAGEGTIVVVSYEAPGQDDDKKGEDVGGE